MAGPRACAASPEATYACCVSHYVCRGLSWVIVCILLILFVSILFILFVDPFLLEMALDNGADLSSAISVQEMCLIHCRDLRLQCTGNQT